MIRQLWSRIKQLFTKTKKSEVETRTQPATPATITARKTIHNDLLEFCRHYNRTHGYIVPPVSAESMYYKQRRSR